MTIERRLKIFAAKSPTVYFTFMGMYLSCNQATFDKLVAFIEQHNYVPDMENYPGTKILRSKPKNVTIKQISPDYRRSNQ